MQPTEAPIRLDIESTPRPAVLLPVMVLTAVVACLIALGTVDALAKQSRKSHHSALARKHKPKKRHPAPPAGPSLATLQRLQCAKYNCDAKTTVTKLRILRRGTTYRGSGPANTWIYPVLMSYDETVTGGHYVGGGFSPLVWVVTTETTRTREKDNVLRHPTGVFVLRFVASSSTCKPDPNACTASVGGGA